MKCETLHLKDFYPFLGDDGRDATVDLYLPYNMTEMKREDWKRPCMIVCPGGGYAFCSQREAEPIATQFLQDGFNVFVLYYSVAPHRFPAQISEVAAVMELIYSHTGEWNCDTAKIGIIGFSAGAHLAAHYSTAYDCNEVRALFPESKPVNFTILGYPVITADPEHANKGSFVNLIGHDPDAAELDKFSCDRLVTDHTPPAFLWHTSEDTCVPVMNSLLYAGALAAHQIHVELHIYPYGYHGLSTADTQTNDSLDVKIQHTNDWLEAVRRWLKLMLR